MGSFGPGKGGFLRGGSFKVSIFFTVGTFFTSFV